METRPRNAGKARNPMWAMTRATCRFSARTSSVTERSSSSVESLSSLSKYAVNFSLMRFAARQLASHPSFLDLETDREIQFAEYTPRVFGPRGRLQAERKEGGMK